MRRTDFIEVTTLKGEFILLNPDHIIDIETCDDGSRISFDKNITSPSEYEQKNYMYIKESYAWMKYELAGKFTDGNEPERYLKNNKSENQ